MLEIFDHIFMIRAFTAGILIAVTAPVIGIFLVVRRYSLIADTLAHVSLAGVAIGLLTKTYPLIWATVVSATTAIGIETLRKSKRVYGEASVALFLQGGMAVAVTLISIARGFNAELFGFLFGAIATVSETDLYFIGILALVIVLAVFFHFKELFAVAFDEELAQLSGMRVKAFNTALVVLAAIAITVATRIVGILLIGALMVVPVLSAMQFSRSFKQTMGISIVVSLVSVIVGLYASYYLDIASGGAIVLIALAIFFVSSIINKNN
ncbi:MAG: metal ABC transporter permease [Nitrospirae bacterium]|nr:metal ABC transporter permease [Nitrospirota bacterium]MBF0534110.1 metal ABC transporter permease [Nitrospirota bacterium]MBF0616997.1 metal ABC transporter permease [Nitrospirota bacterium]